MARVRMVTRTVEVTVAKVMTVNTDTAQVEVLTYYVTGKPQTEVDILKDVAKQEQNTPVAPVKVIETTKETTLYGMTEELFISLAQVLPPRTGNAEIEDLEEIES